MNYLFEVKLRVFRINKFFIMFLFLLTSSLFSGDRFITTLRSDCENRHSFHGTCYLRWEIKKGCKSCPTCRTKNIITKRTDRISELPGECAICLDTEGPEATTASAYYTVAFGATTRTVFRRSKINLPQWSVTKKDNSGLYSLRRSHHKSAVRGGGFRVK